MVPHASRPSADQGHVPGAGGGPVDPEVGLAVAVEVGDGAAGERHRGRGRRRRLEGGVAGLRRRDATGPHAGAGQRVRRRRAHRAAGGRAVGRRERHRAATRAAAGRQRQTLRVGARRQRHRQWRLRVPQFLVQQDRHRVDAGVGHGQVGRVEVGDCQPPGGAPCRDVGGGAEEPEPVAQAHHHGVQTGPQVPASRPCCIIEAVMALRWCFMGYIGLGRADVGEASGPVAEANGDVVCVVVGGGEVEGCRRR